MKYDVIIIGFGQGAHKIVSQLTEADWKIALIEKDRLSYGGSCINFGCIPTKMLEHDARAGISYEKAVERRNAEIADRREGEKRTMDENPNVELYTGRGSFIDNHTVKVELEDEELTLTSDYIFIDTGSVPVIPDIEGYEETEHIYTSKTLQTEKQLPKRLGIIGGGYIGLEFASIYASFGSEVHVFDSSDKFMEDEEPEIAEAIHEVLTEKGITIHLATDITKVENRDKQVTATSEDGESYTIDALLVAVGRKPSTEGLGLENTAIEVNDQGGIEVDNHLQTSAEGVYAVGDVRGEAMFTYITVKDAAIVMDHVLGEGKLLLSDRKNIPSATFIDPPFSRIGLTEAEAKEEGYDILTNSITFENSPKAATENDSRGLFKAVVNRKNKQILGVSLFGFQSQELINQVKMAMDNQIPYTYLREQMMTHPVMTEQLSKVFNM